MGKPCFAGVGRCAEVVTTGLEVGVEKAISPFGEASAVMQNGAATGKGWGSGGPPRFITRQGRAEPRHRLAATDDGPKRADGVRPVALVCRDSFDGTGQARLGGARGLTSVEVGFAQRAAQRDPKGNKAKDCEAKGAPSPFIFESRPSGAVAGVTSWS